ncbi:MAG: dTMP kinase [Gammaproteobacteria bacterium]|nr:dTMP kinase [Gammaproteobacteria bacterium]
MRTQDTKRGKFITFDGIDGAGKTTQINRLSERLIAEGKKVFITREPGGTILSEKIRELLLSNDNTMAATTELLLMFASRAEHVEMVLRPKVEAGEWVICSRFTDATIAYQGFGRGVDITKIRAIADVVHGDFQPDTSFILDLPAEIAAKRRIERGEEVDRFESEAISFMQDVRNGYLTIANSEPARCKVIDARNSVDDMSLAIWQQVELL